MAFLPWFRVIIFTLTTIISLVTLGMGIYVEDNGYIADWDWDYIPIVLVSSCLTCVSLPLFLGLGCCQGRVFTSTILFEFLWFFFLSLLWAVTATISLFESPYCGYNLGTFTLENDFPAINQVCGVAFIGSFFAFVPCGLAFIYDQVILWYAVIKALRGKRIWTISVKEAATMSTSVNPGVPVVEFIPVPDVPPIQPYF